jgi:hypothetical protein
VDQRHEWVVFDAVIPPTEVVAEWRGEAFLEGGNDRGPTPPQKKQDIILLRDVFFYDMFTFPDNLQDHIQCTPFAIHVLSDNYETYITRTLKIPLSDILRLSLASANPFPDFVYNLLKPQCEFFQSLMSIGNLSRTCRLGMQVFEMEVSSGCRPRMTRKFKLLARIWYDLAL